MESHPSWNEWKANRGNCQSFIEGKGQTPNYSFDNWLKMTKSFGDEISSFVGQAKEKDQELDDEISKKKKEPKEKDADDSDADTNDKEAAWKKLRDIAKERTEKKDKKKEKK
jgi:hypothetical protein